jgi:hypothetical protein
VIRLGEFCKLMDDGLYSDDDDIDVGFSASYIVFFYVTALSLN